MDLFNQSDEIQNLLPRNGIANHHGFVFSRTEADQLYNNLLKTITWKNDEVIMYGKRIVTKRKIAWYGEDILTYNYPSLNANALSFTKELLEIKKKIELITDEKYNSCLLNLYHNGSEGLSWHSDDEACFKQNGAIASITLGAERKFAFKHKSTKEVVSLLLQHGSLLLMKGETQTHWLHSLPLTKKVNKPRINITFRTMVN
jgi:alkylated DNA repair dioxygenase AlkB